MWQMARSAADTTGLTEANIGAKSIAGATRGRRVPEACAHSASCSSTSPEPTTVNVRGGGGAGTDRSAAAAGRGGLGLAEASRRYGRTARRDPEHEAARLASPRARPTTYAP